MKKVFGLLVLISMLFLVGCGKEGEIVDSDFSFIGVITKAEDNYFLVEVTKENNSSFTKGTEVDVSISEELAEFLPALEEETYVRVVYDGVVMETYPPRISNVIRVDVTDESGMSIMDAATVNEVEDTTETEIEENNAEAVYGITMTVKNVTPTGLTVVITQSGGNVTGELQTGPDFLIEKYENGQWTEAENPDFCVDYAWKDIAYNIKKDDTTELDVDWEWLLGTLPEGKYRIRKQIMDFRAAGDYDEELFYAEFEITDEMVETNENE